MARLVINDAMWEKLYPLLPHPKSKNGKDDQMLLEAVYWIIRTRVPWNTVERFSGRIKECSLHASLAVIPTNGSQFQNTEIAFKQSQSRWIPARDLLFLIILAFAGMTLAWCP